MSDHLTPKRRVLPEDHQAFREIVNFDNSLALAFGFLNRVKPGVENPSVKIEAVEGGTLDAFENMWRAVNGSRFYATTRLEGYLRTLANPDASALEISKAQDSFYAAYGAAIQQMQTLAKSESHVARGDKGVTVVFAYLDEYGTQKQAEVVALTGAQPIYEGLAYIRETRGEKSVWERQLCKDLERIEELVKNYQAPSGRSGAMAI